MNTTTDGPIRTKHCHWQALKAKVLAQVLAWSGRSPPIALLDSVGVDHRYYGSPAFDGEVHAARRKTSRWRV